MDAFAGTLLGLGIKPEQLGLGQAAARAILIYAATLVIVRLGKRRFMARATAFDVIIGIVIGSIAGRAITGNAPLGTALIGVAVMIAAHWLVSALAVFSHRFGRLVKGPSTLLIRNGEVDEAMLRREHMTAEDLDEDLRQKGRPDCRGIAEGRLERSGKLSVLAASKPPKIVEIAVREGVQTVRIEIG